VLAPLRSCSFFTSRRRLSTYFHRPKVLTTTVSKISSAFNIKLYPPKASGKPILVTTSDASRDSNSGFVANVLPAGIISGDVPVYQEVHQHDEDTDRRSICGNVFCPPDILLRMRTGLSPAPTTCFRLPNQANGQCLESLIVNT